MKMLTRNSNIHIVNIFWLELCPNAKLQHKHKTRGEASLNSRHLFLLAVKINLCICKVDDGSHGLVQHLLAIVLGQVEQ